MRDGFGGRDGGRGPSGAYDHLIDAERDALSRAGKRVDKVPLIKALREATGLGLREAKHVVEGYLARRAGGPAGAVPAPAGWIDDLLDAERKAAARDDRPITKALLIKAVREASRLGLREAKAAVDDYLRRKGGEGLRSGRGGWLVASLLLLAALAAGVAFALVRP